MPPMMPSSEPFAYDEEGDETNNNSPTSTFDYDAIEEDILRLEMSKDLKLDQERLVREVLRHKADSLAQQARLLREESKATEVVAELEESLQVACDQSISCRVAISKLQQVEEIKHLQYEVQILNLKLWEYILQDPDCCEIYSEPIKPRSRPFGDFSHVAFWASDWIKLRQKLEWIERVLVMSEPDPTNSEADTLALKKILKKKAEAIHRFNQLNDIIFEEEDEETDVDVDDSS